MLRSDQKNDPNIDRSHRKHKRSPAQTNASLSHSFPLVPCCPCSNTGNDPPPTAESPSQQSKPPLEPPHHTPNVGIIPRCRQASRRCLSRLHASWENPTKKRHNRKHRTHRTPITGFRCNFTPPHTSSFHPATQHRPTLTTQPANNIHDM